jgi:O-succinylbenzoate synthase
VAAHGTESTRQVVLVRLIDADGGEGWGECSALSAPGYTTEWTAGAWDVLRHQLLPAVVARGVVGDVSAPVVAGHPMASAAVEAAAIDLALRRRGDGLAATLGVGGRHIDRCAVITGTRDPAEAVALVGAAVESGVAMVKLKVSPDWGLSAVDVVRSAFPALTLAVDANGSLGSAPEVLDGLVAGGLAYLEQPFAADELVRSARFVAETGTVVALDESICDVADAERALNVQAGDIINVKPARLGGVVASLHVLAAVQRLQASAFVGGMVETGVGRSVAVTLAARLAEVMGDTALPTDLGPSQQYFDEDVTNPVVTDATGRLVVPTGPGCGVEVLAGQISRFAVKRTTVKPQ